MASQPARQTRRNTETESRSDPLALDPWSDDRCRDYLLQTVLETVAKRAETPTGADEVSAHYTTIFNAASPSPASRDRTGATAATAAAAAAANGPSASPLAAPFADGATPLRQMVPGPRASDRPQGDEGEYLTPSRAIFADAVATAAGAVAGASPEVRVASSPQQEQQHPQPHHLTPIGEVLAHFRGMVQRAVVLERFAVKELQFMSWLLRGPSVVPRKREALLMEMRNHYYETLKSPKRVRPASPQPAALGIATAAEKSGKPEKADEKEDARPKRRTRLENPVAVEPRVTRQKAAAVTVSADVQPPVPPPPLPPPVVAVVEAKPPPRRTRRDAKTVEAAASAGPSPPAIRTLTREDVAALVGRDRRYPIAPAQPSSKPQPQGDSVSVRPRRGNANFGNTKPASEAASELPMAQQTSAAPAGPLLATDWLLPEGHHVVEVQTTRKRDTAKVVDVVGVVTDQPSAAVVGLMPFQLRCLEAFRAARASQFGAVIGTSTPSGYDYTKEFLGR